MVRLQLYKQKIKEYRNGSVSIPLWFDYNKRIVVLLVRSEKSLNSTMVRLQHVPKVDDDVVLKLSQFHYGSITTN